MSGDRLPPSAAVIAARDALHAALAKACAAAKMYGHPMPWEPPDFRSGARFDYKSALGFDDEAEAQVEAFCRNFWRCKGVRCDDELPSANKPSNGAAEAPQEPAKTAEQSAPATKKPAARARRTAPPDDPAVEAFLAAGCALIPIPLGSKGPRINGWQRRENCVFGAEHAAQFAGINAGLVHEHSGTCAVDIDDHDAADAWLTPRGINLEQLFMTEDAVSVSSGRPNHGKLLYRLPDGIEAPPTVKIKDDADKVILELRCAGSQDIIAGKHPSGTAYSVTGDPATMPPLPDTLLSAWQEDRTFDPARARGSGAQADNIREGGRNEALTREAGRLRHIGLSPAAIAAALQQVNAERCNPPLAQAEVESIARSVGRYPPNEQPSAPTPEMPASYTASELAARPATAREWIVDQWLPAGANVALGGHGGSGKSILVAMLAVCVASSRMFYGLAVKQGPVLIYACEDDADEWTFRLQCAAACLGVDLASLPITVIDALECECSPALYATPATDPGAPAMVTAVGAWLAEKVEALKAVLVILDSATDTFAGDEIRRREVRNYLRVTRHDMAAAGACIVHILHIDKLAARGKANNTDLYSGSTDWNNGVRARLALYRPKPLDSDDAADERNTEEIPLRLELQKANYAKPGAFIELRYDEQTHVFVQVGGSATLATTSSLVESIEQRRTEDAILTFITQAETDGEPVSEGKTAHRNLHVRMIGANALPNPSFASRRGKTRLFKALERLRAEHKIGTKTIKTKQRKTTEVLTAMAHVGAKGDAG